MPRVLKSLLLSKLFSKHNKACFFTCKPSAATLFSVAYCTLDAFITICILHIITCTIFSLTCIAGRELSPGSIMFRGSLISGLPGIVWPMDKGWDKFWLADNVCGRDTEEEAGTVTGNVRPCVATNERKIKLMMINIMLILIKIKY